MEPNPVCGKRILLVEDEPEGRRLLRTLLSVDGHIITEASTGKEACLVYAPGDFDFVITDYAMPEMKGDELARTIKCLVPAQRIIMITGMPWTLAGPNNPVDALLIKPVSLSEIREYLAAVMSRQSDNLPFPWCSSKFRKGIGLGLT